MSGSNDGRRSTTVHRHADHRGRAATGLLPHHAGHRDDDEPQRVRRQAEPDASSGGHGEHIVVSQPHDPDEQVAEMAAARVAAGLPAGLRYRAPSVAPMVASSGKGPVSAALAAAGPGRPLAGDVRQSMEQAFEADLGSVRVHDDQRADVLSRHFAATAFTVGRDVYFRRGAFARGNPAGTHLLAHELAHVVQDGAAPVRTAGPERVHRHASWEHKMLGDVVPADLEVVAAGRDLAEARRRDKASQGVFDFSESTISSITITAVDGTQRTLTSQEILHVIDQEIERLSYFKTLGARSRAGAAEGTDAAQAEQYLRDQDMADRVAEYQKVQPGVSADRAKTNIEVARNAGQMAKWDLKLVTLTVNGRQVVVTYGEMNTLADFFGSLEEIGQTDFQKFISYLEGIREESIRKWMRMRNEIGTGLGEKGKKYDSQAAQHRVGQSMGTQGRTQSSGGPSTSSRPRVRTTSPSFG
jgi:hypothetical protein